jgi:hypothetical protein
MFGTPLVPMMLLTVMIDCWPLAHCAAAEHGDLRPDLPAHLVGGVVQHGLLQRNPRLGQSLGGQLQDLQNAPPFKDDSAGTRAQRLSAA